MEYHFHTQKLTKGMSLNISYCIRMYLHALVTKFSGYKYIHLATSLLVWPWCAMYVEHVNKSIVFAKYFTHKSHLHQV